MTCGEVLLFPLLRLLVLCLLLLVLCLLLRLLLLEVLLLKLVLVLNSCSLRGSLCGHAIGLGYRLSDLSLLFLFLAAFFLLTLL